MAIQTGITESQARKLMELAKRSGQRPKVRTVQKDSNSQHSGRAFLLDVLNDHQARIQPFNHGGKVELVELDSLRLWKSGNNFDIEEIRNMSVAAVAIPATGEGLSTDQFFIFSKKMKAVWGGERSRWTQNFHQAAYWVSSEHDVSERVLRRLKAVQESNDALLLSRDVAYEALLEAATEPSVQQTIEVKPSLPSLLTQKVEPMNSAPQIPIADDFFDMGAAFNPQETALRKAENDRKEAILEYTRFKTTFDEIKKKCMTLDANVVALGGQSVLKGAATQSKSGKRTRVPLRGKIQQVLLISSRLDNKSIAARIKADIPDITALRVSQALAGMKIAGQAEKNEGGWALTKEGRISAKEG